MLIQRCFLNANIEALFEWSLRALEKWLHTFPKWEWSLLTTSSSSIWILLVSSTALTHPHTHPPSPTPTPSRSIDGIMNILQTATEHRRNLDVVNEMISFVNSKLPQLFMNTFNQGSSSTNGDQLKLEVQKHSKQPFIVLSSRRATGHFDSVAEASLWRCGLFYRYHIDDPCRMAATV